MCIIAFQPAGVDIPKATLEQCWDSNPDGAGFMYATEGTIRIHKGFMTWTEFWKAYREHWKTYGSTCSFVVHFRVATVGKVKAATCHPHSVSDRYAIAHNGTLGNVTPYMGKKDWRSDSMYLAQEILSKLPDNWESLEPYGILMDALLGTNKMALLNSEGDVWIFNEQLGESQKDGVWFSNDTYKRDRYPAVTTWGKPKKSKGNKGAASSASSNVHFDDWMEADSTTRCTACGDLMTWNEVNEADETGIDMCESCIWDLWPHGEPEEDTGGYMAAHLEDPLLTEEYPLDSRVMVWSSSKTGASTSKGIVTLVDNERDVIGIKLDNGAYTEKRPELVDLMEAGGK